MWSAADARQPLEELMQTIGLRGEVHLLHFAKTAVFSLPEEKLAVRVSRPSASYTRAVRSLRFAEWVEDRGRPGPRVAGEVSRQPFRVGEVLLSFWRIDNFQPSPSAPEFGQALRAFHSEISDWEDLLPEADPLGDIAEMLRGLQEGPWQKDLPLLWDWHSRLQESWGEVPSLLGEGPLHGNAHRGNAARIGGDVCLMDFDLLCRGPREWDLLPEALRVRRYGRSQRDYDLFARTYGFDVFSWPGFQEMALVRELLATVFRMQADRGLPGETESDRRLLYWRGENPPPWRGF